MAAVPSTGRATGVEPNGSGGEATRSLYERFHGQIFGFCLNQLGSREEAEDATQSTFLNVHRAFEAGKTPDAESAWLFKIAHNVCLSRRRSTFRRRRVESPSDLQTVQDLLPAPQRDGSDDLIRLTDALADMPDNQRRAILLREWQGLSYREIAGELDLSQAAVETLIFRARRSLVQNLKESEAPVERRVGVVRVRRALDFGSLAAALKAALGTSTAVKAAATAVAVTGTAVVATSPLAHKLNQAAPLERESAARPALQSAQHFRSAPAALRSLREQQRAGAFGLRANRLAAVGSSQKKRSSPRLARGSSPPATQPAVDPLAPSAPPAEQAPVSEPDQTAPTGGQGDHGPSSSPPEQQPQRTPAGPEHAQPEAPLPPKGESAGEGHGQGSPSDPGQKDKDRGGDGKGTGEPPAPQAGTTGQGNSSQVEKDKSGRSDKPEKAKK